MTYPLIQNHTYDSLNRLDDASETSNGTQTWRQDFSYDRYGNRNFVEPNTSFAGFDKLCNSNTELCATLRRQLNPGINSGNNNRMNSGQDYTYDSAGNTLTDANGQTFIYDGENKQVEVRNSSNAAIGKYWYDGDGLRVKKEVPGTGEVTIFVYDAAGKQIAEYSTVVASANDAKVAYLTADHLGSPRINTDVTGAVSSRHDYHPFGEEIAATGSRSTSGYVGDAVRKQFTGYERDNESGLDFAQARYYGNSLGRFTSPDPLYIEFRRLPHPQAWNLYAYTRNNPLTFVDPDGLEVAVNCKTNKEQTKACQEQVTTDLNNRKDAQFKVEIKNGKLAIVGKVDASKLSKSERKLYGAITDSFGKATLNVEMSSDKITFGRFDGAGQNSVDLSDLSKLNASGNKTLAGEVIAHEAIEGYESSLDLFDPDNPDALYNSSHATANQFFGGVEIELSDASNLAGARVSSRDATFNFGRLGTSVTVTKKFKTPIPLASITRGNFPNLVGDIDKVVAPTAPTQTPVKPKEKP